MRFLDASAILAPMGRTRDGKEFTACGDGHREALPKSATRKMTRGWTAMPNTFLAIRARCWSLRPNWDSNSERQSFQIVGCLSIRASVPNPLLLTVKNRGCPSWTLIEPCVEPPTPIFEGFWRISGSWHSLPSSAHCSVPACEGDNLSWPTSYGGARVVTVKGMNSGSTVWKAMHVAKDIKGS
jgi:hypothetical protein